MVSITTKYSIKKQEKNRLILQNLTSLAFKNTGGYLVWVGRAIPE